MFDRTCNLISAEGGLISLVTQEIGDGPFSLVASPITFSRYVTSESHVVRENGVLRVGKLEIDTTLARLWDACPDWDLLRKEIDRIRECVPFLIKVLRASAPTGSLAELVVSQHDLTPPGDKPTLGPSRASIDKLLDGLRRSDRVMFEEAASELAGCGIGLTPEGDDFLLGCLVAIHILYEDQKADELAGAIAATAARSTTVLSAEWLQAGARGEIARPWHILLDRMVQADEDKIKTSAETILQHGHTSGSAALAGFSAVLQSPS